MHSRQALFINQRRGRERLRAAGPLPVWKTLPTDSGRRLIINLDHPELPWAHVSRSIQEAYNFCLCMDIRLRQGNASASAFPNYFEQDLPVVVSPEPMPEMEKFRPSGHGNPVSANSSPALNSNQKHFPTPSRNPSGRATRPEESTSSPGGAFKKKRMRPPGKMTSWLCRDGECRYPATQGIHVPC